MYYLLDSLKKTFSNKKKGVTFLSLTGIWILECCHHSNDTETKKLPSQFSSEYLQCIDISCNIVDKALI